MQYSYNFSYVNIQSSNATLSSEDVTLTCTEPSTSYLFDRIVPTLIVQQNGNIQTNQLLTIRSSPVMFTFNFSGTPNYDTVRKIEIVLLNSDGLGSSIQEVALLTDSGVEIKVIHPNITSTESFVLVCLTNLTISSTLLSLNFITTNTLHQVFLAEVKFYEEGIACTSGIVENPMKESGK